MKKSLKEFNVFAGIDGAGKTTLYFKQLETEKNKNFGLRVNIDEIVQAIGDWKNPKDQTIAARIALEIRVSKGGHDIAPELIKRRYKESLKNLKEILPIVDNLYLFDNSKEFKSIKTKKDIENTSWLKDIDVSQKIVEIKPFKPKDKTISKNKGIER